MTVLDWVLVVILGGITLSGFWKGAVRVVFGLGGLAVGIWLMIAAGADLAVALEAYITPVWLAAVAGRALPLLLAVLLFTAAGWGIERTLKALRLGWANHLLGAILTGAVGCVLVGLLLVLSLGISPKWADVCRDSLLFPYFVEVAELVFGSTQRS